MKKLFIPFLGLLLLFSCQQPETLSPPDRTISEKEEFQKWWESVNIIDENLLAILSTDPRFTNLCKRLDQEKLFLYINEGIPMDFILKNYPQDLHELIIYGSKKGISNILLYKEHYLASIHPVTKEVIVVGECELKEYWRMAHQVCKMAYEEGLNIYKVYGCCEYRFKRSIEQAVFYLPEANHDVCRLFSYVVDPALLNYECPYYVDLMDRIGVPKYERKQKLLTLERLIDGIIIQIAQQPKFWAPCSCKGKGDEKDTIPIDQFPPVPDYVPGEYPPKVVEATYENRVTFNIIINLLSKFSNLNLEWFMDMSRDSIYECSMSFNRNMVTGEYTRTMVKCDNKTNEVGFDIKNTNNVTTVAVIHNHPNEDPHSVHDILTLADICTKSDGILNTSMVSTRDNNLFILYVKDPQKAQKFRETYFTEEKEYQLKLHYERNIEVISRQTGSIEMQMCDIMMFAKAAILNNYDAGIIILKQDKDSNLTLNNAYYNNGLITMQTVNAQ